MLEIGITPKKISAGNPIRYIKFDGKKSNERGTVNTGKVDGFPNIIISDFRSDVGEIPDIISFNREYLNRPYLSPKQIEAYHAIWGEKGGDWSTRFHETVLLIGMKGGKNFWSEGDVAYTCFFISCLKDPHAYFTKITKRLVPYTPEKTFDIINVSSVNETQARNAFFNSVKKVLKLTIDPKTGENWFQKFAGLDLREQFGDFGKREIIFPTSREGQGGIRLLSFNSTATAPEGIHILRYYADELSRAETKSKYIEASALLELGLNNTSASFPNCVGKVIEWSYPNNTDFDLTNERYELSLTTDSIFGLKCTTYDFNPALTKETFANRYKADPVDAKRVFECVKPISKDNFFNPYTDKIEEAFEQNIENLVEYRIVKSYTNIKNKATEKTTRKAYTTAEIISIKGDNRLRCFTADFSKNKDRFVIEGGYNKVRDYLKIELFEGEEKEIITTNVTPINDISIVIEPLPGCPIDYDSIGKIFTRLLEAFPNAVSFTSDHFQNETLRRQLEMKGLRAETYFFSNQMQMKLYKLYRFNIWNNNIHLCNDQTKITIANKERTVKELNIHEAQTIYEEGGKIDHAKNSSKDVLDGQVILNYDLMMLETNKQNQDTDILLESDLRKLTDTYIETKFELLQVDIPEPVIKSVIREKLSLSEKQYDILAKYVKENFDY